MAGWKIFWLGIWEYLKEASGERDYDHYLEWARRAGLAPIPAATANLAQIAERTPTGLNPDLSELRELDVRIRAPALRALLRPVFFRLLNVSASMVCSVSLGFLQQRDDCSQFPPIGGS